MADLSVAHRAALAQLLESVPDRALKQLSLMATGMPGDRARSLETMLAAETLDRTRRARAFGPLAPLFRPRPDEVHSTTFPSAVLPRLWKIAAGREAALLPLLDGNAERDRHQALTVCGRLCMAAAAAARDQPAAVWPQTLCDPDLRETGLAELARCFDLGPLIHRGLPDLKTWIGRPDEDQLAELRLLVRDCADVAPDGARRLLEILFAHLGDGALVLRLVVHASSASAREALLAESEMSTFVDRLIEAVEVRTARTAALTPRRSAPDAVQTLKVDVLWAAAVLAELDITLQLRPESPWGLRVRMARLTIGQSLAGLIAACPQAVDRTLPMTRVQTAGRMTRVAPRLDAVIPLQDRAGAEDALALLRAMRGPASAFGCEAKRQQLTQGLVEQLTDFADLAIEAINGGEVVDEDFALEKVEMTARFLDQIDAPGEARIVRRRAAVAGRPRTARRTSPDAA